MFEIVFELIVWLAVACLRWLLTLGKKPFATFLDHDIEGTTVVLSLAVAFFVLGVKFFHKVF